MNYLVESADGKLRVLTAKKLQEIRQQNSTEKVTVHGRLMPANDSDFTAVFNEQLNATLLTGERLAVA